MFTLESLPKKIQTKIKYFIQEMVHIHKNDLVSISLYGDLLSTGYHKELSIKILSIHKEVNLNTLMQMKNLIKKGRRHGIIAPLMLTQQHIDSSSDVFPIEFLDFKKRHQVLWGSDPLSEITINDENLRLECEQQFKGKLIRIRQSILETGLKPKECKHMIRDSLLSFIPVFEAMLHLKQISTDQESLTFEETVLKVASAYKLNALVFIRANDAWQNKKLLKSKELEHLLHEYIIEIQLWAQTIDQLEV